MVVSYIYDAWGKVYSVTGSMADTLGTINPIRYRSYYYDNETGFYYLNSRYYDPEVKRFINADSNLYPQTGLLGVNLFAYCRNNPVNLYDENGEFGKWLKGLALAAVGVVAVVTSVATLGAATPLWVGVAACVGIAGGSACIVMGASEMAEAHTGTNVVKETVFNGDDQSYNTARNIAQASAEIGSRIAAVGKAATDYIAKKSVPKVVTKVTPQLPQNRIKISANDALDLADDFLGKGYKEVSPGRFISSDGLRQVRMGMNDLLGNHGGGPHINFDIINPKYKSIHVFFVD